MAWQILLCSLVLRGLSQFARTYAFPAGQIWRVVSALKHEMLPSCQVTCLLFFPCALPQFAFILCTRLFYFKSPYEHTLLVPTADEPCAAQSVKSKVQWSSCQDKPTDTGAHVADAIVSWDAVRHWNNTRQGNGEKRVNKQANRYFMLACTPLLSGGPPPFPIPWIPIAHWFVPQRGVMNRTTKEIGHECHL